MRPDERRREASALRETVVFVSYLAAGLAAATVAGWLTLGGIIFVQPAFLLRYLAVGFSGALIYVAVRTRGVLLALMMILTLLAGNILLSNSWDGRSLAEAAIWAAFAGAAYLGAALLFRALRRLFLGKFVFMGALLATAYAAGSVTILLLRGRPLHTGVILNPAIAGLRLGALSGFLFEVVDFFGGRPVRAADPQAGRLAGVLDRHLVRYPLMRAGDIYKLAHQGVFGPGHIIADPAQALRALDEELAALRGRYCGHAVEPVEEIDPAGGLVRVNLEPLKDAPDAAERLLPALLAAAAETRGEPALMAERMAEALAWCREKLPEQVEALAGLAAEASEAGWPARHHSQVYTTAYRPAYRVVSAAAWARAGRPSGSSG